MDHHHSPKKAKIAGLSADDVVSVTIDQLEDNLLADVFGWLRVEEIMGKRGVCKKWKEAVKKTIVPPTKFWVESVEKYNAMAVMTRALPNLQQIAIRGFREDGHNWSDGEDSNEAAAAYTADWTTHDIEITSNFSKLRILTLYSASLNGRYPFLFNFPLLQILSISECCYLKWDLEMLAGLPSLKELHCYRSTDRLTGNISSLRVLKGTLEKVKIFSCDNVEGNFMDLADFPHLKELRLDDTAVTGDIRDIGENDFSSLEELILPRNVYGGFGYEFQRISDGRDLAAAVYLLKKQRRALRMDDSLSNWFAFLSRESPDRYESPDGNSPPFNIQFVQAGSRLGYQWYANPLGCSAAAALRGNTCEVNWLDPEPDREGSDYGKYIEELQKIERRVGFYRRFHQPPTEEEYERLLDEHYGEQITNSV
jgi:hypothetical protein